MTESVVADFDSVKKTTEDTDKKRTFYNSISSAINNATDWDEKSGTNLY